MCQCILTKKQFVNKYIFFFTSVSGLKAPMSGIWHLIFFPLTFLQRNKDENKDKEVVGKDQSSWFNQKFHDVVKFVSNFDKAIFVSHFDMVIFVSNIDVAIFFSFLILIWRYLFSNFGDIWLLFWYGDIYL